ncbi:ferredoxin-type protein NapF [Sulfurimonas sp.]|uniref:ferredoxin-type protein NapF n=1 Tax=Sulfurimonas sp. TaxID=2022749 RepID=UPI002AB0818E|nr:ferredoxin-type protein NapF [Sulfurimonas sp.]
MQRRELFSFLSSSIKGEGIKAKQTILRPPYFRDESLFQSECNKCEAKCAAVCEEEIIKIAEDKTPYLDFSKSGCTFCDECAKVCEFDVLNLEDKKNIDAIVTINKNECLSWKGIMCFSCKDPCLDNAIKFQAMFMPEIEQDKCTACGFCLSRCPAAAIDFKEIKND